MVNFKSIIVFDLETTSKPEIDHNTTRITELAFIGCEVEHLKQSRRLPRVLHKLVLLFNPYKMIHPDSSDISGLTNNLLEHLKGFRKEDVDILRHFISRLPEPVCIVAHNGDKFDFPILRRAMVNAREELQNNVYCADSLKAFRCLCSKKNEQLQTRRLDIQTVSENTPPHQNVQPVNQLHSKKVCRALFSENETHSHSGIPVSYRLKDIYYFFFHCHFPDAHRSEKDSEALLSCIIKCEGFIEWISQNAVVFNSIEPLF